MLIINLCKRLGYLLREAGMSFSFFFLCILLFGCEGNKTSRIVKVLEVDTVFISLPNNTSASLIQPATWLNSGKEFLAAYNYLDHSLSIIDLSNLEYHKHIKLDEHGPNFVEGPNGIAFYEDSGLLLSSSKYLTLIGFDGKVRERIRLNDVGSSLTGFDFIEGRLDISRHSGLQFDKRSGEILLAGIRRESSGIFKKYIAAVNIEQRKVRLIKVPEFKSKSQGESFGNLNGFSFRRLDDGFIVNPRHASELVLMNSEIEYYSINSSLTDNKAQVYNGINGQYSSILDHEIKSVEFYPVYETYDKS